MERESWIRIVKRNTVLRSLRSHENILTYSIITKCKHQDSKRDVVVLFSFLTIFC
jgi:hypothetical protein